MKSIALVSMLLALVTHTAGANPLYQWIEKDGTPTFSPDPPPKGVDYTIVGPDLEPLTGQTPVQAAAPAQPAKATTTAAKPAPATAPKLAGAVVLTPAPQDAVQQPVKKAKPSKWKPVQYADDPNPVASKPVITNSTKTSASVTAPLTRVSDECLGLKQQQLILESQFAGAHSPQDMDRAVLQLNNFHKQNKGVCGY